MAPWPLRGPFRVLTVAIAVVSFAGCGDDPFRYNAANCQQAGHTCYVDENNVPCQTLECVAKNRRVPAEEANTP
jgi:hypothetical protein